MKPKGMQYKKDNKGWLYFALILVIIWGLSIFLVIYFFSMPTPLPGNKVVTYSIGPGILAANFIPKSQEDAEKEFR